MDGNWVEKQARLAHKLAMPTAGDSLLHLMQRQSLPLYDPLHVLKGKADAIAYK